MPGKFAAKPPYVGIEHGTARSIAARASLIAVSRRWQRNAHGCPGVARIDVNPAVVIEDRAFDNRQA